LIGESTVVWWFNWDASITTEANAVRLLTENSQRLPELTADSRPLRVKVRNDPPCPARRRGAGSVDGGTPPSPRW